MNHTGNVVAKNNGIVVINCLQCGFTHQKPLPNQFEIEAYYNNDQFYTTHSPVSWFAENKVEHETGLWHPAYNYQAKLFNYNGFYPSVVDIGCGDGWWLNDYIKYYNAQSVGVEPSKIARSYSPVSQRIFSNIYAVSYNAYRTHASVRLALVLEHVVDPVETLMTIKSRFCGRHSKVLIVVPNEFNPLQKIIQRQINTAWYVQKPHINYFSKNSINYLLNKCGFEVIHQSGTFPMELFYLMGYHYIGNDEIGNKCHHMRLNFEKKLGVKAFSLYHMLYKTLGWGRETIIMGKVR